MRPIANRITTQDEATLWDNADFQEYWKSKITQPPKKSDTILEYFAQIQKAIRVGDLQGADRDNTHLSRSLWDHAYDTLNSRNPQFAETTLTTAPLHMDAMELFSIEAEMASSLNGMSDEDIRSFAELQEDLATDEKIELYIYTCFLTFMRMGSVEHLEQAIQRTEGWVAVTPSDHPDRARRFQIFDTLLARTNQHTLAPSNIAAVVGSRFERTGLMDDLNRAVDVASKAVDATPQDRPDRVSYLNSLGNLLGRRFQRMLSACSLSRQCSNTSLTSHSSTAPI
ncbi:hypothetical protein HD806DRAFT_116532 [Xylariaceae sp. AK1471]|nr:hypothetical protein HD806DRAFT_116532 [Xylariaceae sp. AK1471]